MIITFIIIVSLAMFHYVYEGAIAPSLRMNLRNELFSIRDRLRSLKLNSEIDKDDMVFFSILEASLNYFLISLSSINIKNQIKVKIKINNDEKLKIKLDKRVLSLQNSSNNQLKKIFDEINIVVVKALLVNSGGLLSLIVPSLFFFICFAKIKRLVSEIIVAPSYVIKKISPDML